MDRIKTYEEFWPYYLKEHSHPWTRRLHVIGTCLGLIAMVILVAESRYAYLPLCLVIGYFFAWVSHFFIEHNRPATFQYPWWSFISDFKMAALYLTGKLPPPR